MPINWFKARLEQFRDESKGSVSIEFLMWTPLMVGVISLMVQASVLFTTQSNYWSVSRDTARLVARHALTEVEAEAYATQMASAQTSSPVADVIIGPSTVTVNLSIAASSVTPITAFGFLNNVMINASVTQALEPI